MRPLPLIVALLGLAACSSHHPAPAPSTIPVPSTTTTSVDPATIDLGTIAGETPSAPVPMGPGTATLGGIVTGPDGPVAGATVHIERIVEAGEATADVATAADGTWSLPSVLGGLYRVRAWRVPDLALPDADVVWVGATETHQVNIQLDSYGGIVVEPSLAPSPPIIGEPANLVVQVTASTVDPDGIIRAKPVAGTVVQLFGQGDWQVDGSLTKTTPASGSVSWQLTCEQLGNQPLSVAVGDSNVFPLNLAPCSPVPPTTTSTSTTSTTIRSGPSTTLRPPLARGV